MPNIKIQRTGEVIFSGGLEILSAVDLGVSQSEENSRRHPACLQCEHACVSDRGTGKAGQNRQLEGDPACKAAFGGCRVGR